MSKTLDIQDLATWKVSYNLYSDILQVFVDRVFGMKDNELSSVSFGDATLLYSKRGQEPVLLELNKAYEHLGTIDNLSNEDIIQGIIKYVKLWKQNNYH